MYSLYDDQSLSGRVSPFGYRRIVGYLLLPAAFRSLSRPSSALSAKASTLRSLLLDHLRMYSVTFNGWFLINNCFALFLDVTSNKEITGYFDVLIFFINVSMCSFQGTVVSECYYTRY